jgi:hypothetical protein
VFWIVIRTRLLQKRYLERGRSYVRRKVCLWYIFLHCLHFSGILCNLMKYDIACPLKVINRFNVDILLYLSIGIFSLNRITFIYIACTEPKIWTCKIPGYFSTKRKRVNTIYGSCFWYTVCYCMWKIIRRLSHSGDNNITW